MNQVEQLLSAGAATKRPRTLPALLLGAGLLLAGAALAQAALFTWSFSNVVGDIAGTVGGTLEVGEGTNVSATSVVLTSTTNPVFAPLIGRDFATLPNFRNLFNVSGGNILAAAFANDWFESTVNISLELNSNVFGDDNSQNLGLLTSAGNPLETGICPDGCLQTANVRGDNTGQTQYAPTFAAQVPEPASLALLLAGLLPMFRRALTRSPGRAK